MFLYNTCFSTNLSHASDEELSCTLEQQVMVLGKLSPSVLEAMTS